MNEDQEVAPPHPRTVAFWVSRIFLAALIVLIGWSGWRLSYRVIDGKTDRLLADADKPPAVPRDEAWAKTTEAAIAAIDSEIQAAKEPYERHEASASKRTISREDDRKESARLNQVVLDLQLKRASVATDLAKFRAKASEAELAKFRAKTPEAENK